MDNYDYQFSLLRQNDKNTETERKKDYVKIKIEGEENKVLLDNINEKYIIINNTIDNYNLNELNKQIIKIDIDITNMLTLETDINFIKIKNHKSQLANLYNIILKLQEDKNNNKILDLEEENNFYTELISNIDKLYKKMHIIDNNKKICKILEELEAYKLSRENNTKICEEFVKISNSNVNTIKSYVSLVSWLMMFTIVSLAILLLCVVVNIIIMYNYM